MDDRARQQVVDTPLGSFGRAFELESPLTEEQERALQVRLDSAWAEVAVPGHHAFSYVLDLEPLLVRLFEVGRRLPDADVRGARIILLRCLDEERPYVDAASFVRLGVRQEQRFGGAGRCDLKKKALFLFALRQRTQRNTPLLHPAPIGIGKEEVLCRVLRKLLLNQAANKDDRKLPLPRLIHREDIHDIAPPIRDR